MNGLRPATLVARFSLSELLWSPRTLAMVALAGAPLGLALAYRVALALRATETGGASVFSTLVSSVFFPFVAPMLSLVYASGVVRDDVEAGTMPYFLTRPLSRASFLSGKMLASFTMTLALLLPSLVLVYYVALSPSGWAEVGARFPDLARDLAVAALGLAAYNGVFALAGTVLKRPLLAGLFFIVQRESQLPGPLLLFRLAELQQPLQAEAEPLHPALAARPASLARDSSNTAPSAGDCRR